MALIGRGAIRTGKRRLAAMPQSRDPGNPLQSNGGASQQSIPATTKFRPPDTSLFRIVRTGQVWVRSEKSECPRPVESASGKTGQVLVRTPARQTPGFQPKNGAMSGGLKLVIRGEMPQPD
jgi:hypothetical protein